MEAAAKVFGAMFTWCLGTMIFGLVLRINWELFMLGWRAVG